MTYRAFDIISQNAVPRALGRREMDFVIVDWIVGVFDTRKGRIKYGDGTNHDVQYNTQLSTNEVEMGGGGIFIPLYGTWKYTNF